ncbi:hypothetical protein M9Y10_004201 [Tritrichomonas musculus]|uniref:Uncharacterized protein n=1 Tax=Tritrichomonas musculus TaxID=1915356 RepID=A0ABR2JUB0_9EUKA
MTEFKPQKEMNNESRLEYYSKALERNQPLTVPEIAEYRDLLRKHHTDSKVPEKDQSRIDFYSSTLGRQPLSVPEWNEYEDLLKKYYPAELTLARYQQALVRNVEPQTIEMDPNEQSRLQFYCEALEKDQNLTDPEIAEYKELLRKNKHIVDIPPSDESRLDYYSQALEKQALTGPEWTEYETLLKKYRPYEIGLAKYKQKTTNCKKPQEDQDEMDSNDKSRLEFYCLRLEKNQLLTPPELTEYKELLKKSKHKIDIPPGDESRMDYYSKALEKQSLTEPEWKEYESLLKKYNPYEVGLAKYQQKVTHADKKEAELLDPNDQSRLELYCKRLEQGQMLTDPELNEYKDLLEKSKRNLQIPDMDESRMQYYSKALNKQSLTDPEWKEYETLLKKYVPYELGLAFYKQHVNSREEKKLEIDPSDQNRLEYYSKALKNNQLLAEPELNEYKELLRKYQGDPQIPVEDDNRIQYYEKALKKAPLTDPEWAEYEALIKKYKPYELGISVYLQKIKKNDS